jgi:hypothetical protein
MVLAIRAVLAQRGELAAAAESSNLATQDAWESAVAALEGVYAGAGGSGQVAH